MCNVDTCYLSESGMVKFCWTEWAEPRLMHHIMNTQILSATHKTPIQQKFPAYLIVSCCHTHSHLPKCQPQNRLRHRAPRVFSKLIIIYLLRTNYIIRRAVNQPGNLCRLRHCRAASFAQCGDSFVSRFTHFQLALGVPYGRAQCTRRVAECTRGWVALATIHGAFWDGCLLCVFAKSYGCVCLNLVAAKCLTLAPLGTECGCAEIERRALFCQNVFNIIARKMRGTWKWRCTKWIMGRDASSV